MILFLFFDPECEGCKEEFEQLKIYRDSLLDCQIIFVTTQTKTITTVFLQQIDFHMQENMLILRDTNADLAQKMDVNIVPSTLIYDINRKLINRYVGQVNMEILTKYMSK
jgi:protein-disulfide isomerase